MSDETADLINRLRDEADLCRNETATDVAALLDEAADAIDGREAEPVGEVVGVAGSVGEMRVICWRDRYSPAVGTKLYTAPPAQPKVVVTDAMVVRMANLYAHAHDGDPKWEGRLLPVRCDGIRAVLEALSQEPQS